MTKSDFIAKITSILKDNDVIATARTVDLNVTMIDVRLDETANEILQVFIDEGFYVPGT